MRRREFVALMGASVAWPFAALAQQAGRTYRVGGLSAVPRISPPTVAMFGELRRLGFIEGQNLTIDWRVYALHIDLIPEFAAELVKAKVDVIYASGDAGIRAAQQATATIPILGITQDMVGQGLVNSLARPGGNTTGVSVLATDLDGKRQDILIEAVPGLHRMAILADTKATRSPQLQALQDAARARGVEVSIHRVASAEEITATIDTAKASAAAALNVLSSPLLYGNRQLIIDRVAVLRLPAIYPWVEEGEEGGFLAYGPRIVQIFRELLTQQLVKLLRGVKPADIPIEQPTKFELVINLKTANAMGVTVPATCGAGRQGDRVRRRDFVVGVLLTGTTVSARAQRRAKVYRLAIVDTINPVIELTEAGELPYYRGFFERFRQLRFAEGQNLKIERYSGEGHPERFGDMVSEVVNLKPDAIFVTSTRLLSMLKGATTTIPLVGLMGDPVRFGLVASMARPGGNITGVSVDPGMEFYHKRYQLLKEAVPKVAKLGILISRVFLEKTADGAAMREAARSAGIELILPTIEAPYWRDEEYRAAFTRMAEESVDGIVVATMVENWTYRRLIITLAKEFRLPAIYPDRIFVELGGMMSFGPDSANAGRDCARVVAEIFNGANPANIPISQPTKYELCFNLNTAKALGIEIPPSLLVQADKVIE